MPIAINLTVRQKAGERGSLEAWGEALSDPRPALNKIGVILRENLEARFASNTDPWGAGWAPLSPVTIALRGGDLDADRSLAERINVRVDGTKVWIGIRSAVARLRQYGAPRNRMYGKAPAPIPARPMLPVRSTRRIDLPRDLLARILETVRDSLRQAGRAGGRSPE